MHVHTYAHAQIYLRYVAQFKTRQIDVKTNLPNLMLAKFSRYTV